MFFRVMDKARLPELVRGLATEFEVVGPGRARARRSCSRRSTTRRSCGSTTTRRCCRRRSWFFPPEEDDACASTWRTTRSSTTRSTRRRACCSACTRATSTACCSWTTCSSATYVDPYYKARRENTLVVGVSLHAVRDVLLQRVGHGRGALGLRHLLHGPRRPLLRVRRAR